MGEKASKVSDFGLEPIQTDSKKMSRDEILANLIDKDNSDSFKVYNYE